MDQRGRVGPGDIVRVRSQRWRVAAHLSFGAAAIVDAAGIDAANRGQHARFVLPFETMEHLPHVDAPVVVRPRRWRHAVRHILAEALPSPAALRAAAAADFALLPYQLEPALAVTRGAGTRLLIADVVGLGKTVQAALIIAEVLARARDGRALVLCPAGLREQWKEELDARFGLRAGLIDSSTLAGSHMGVAPGASPWTMQPVAIASVDYVKRPEVLRGLEEVVWDVVVLDEAHALCGLSDRAAAASALAARARTVVMLTATPHSGDDDAFARLCDVGRLPGDEPLLLFRRTRHDAGMTDGRRVHWLNVRLTPLEHRMHSALRVYANEVSKAVADASPGAALGMIVLQRRACSSAQSLARSIERRLALLCSAPVTASTQLPLPFESAPDDDDEPLAELAFRGLPDAAAEHRHLETIGALARRAATAESKLHRLRRLIDRIHEPVIVFTEYRDTLAQVAAILGDLNYVVLHGGMTPSERRDAACRFTTGTARILLATDAASEGLNLHQRCRLVINLELPWTPLRLEQRVGRVDRIGQSQRVHVVHFVGGGTMEENMKRRLNVRGIRARTTLAAIEQHSRVLDVPPPQASNAHPQSRRSIDAVTPHLRNEAIAEAQRLTLARALVRSTPPVDIVRAPVTALRRRSTPPRSYWLWRIRIEDAAADWVWDSYVSFVATSLGVRLQTPAQVRGALPSRRRDVESSAANAAARELQQFADALARPLMLAAARERAIGDGIAAQRGTMAVAVVQRGLFDRRAERDATLRTAALDSAYARSTDRLDQLARLEIPRACAPQLAFAVFLA